MRINQILTTYIVYLFSKKKINSSMKIKAIHTEDTAIFFFLTIGYIRVLNRTGNHRNGLKTSVYIYY